MADITRIDGASDEAIAAWLAAHLRRAFDASGSPVAMTVPGGSTPFPIIELLLAHELTWKRLVVWPSDDRIVPEDHEASNTGRLRRLFEPVGAEVATLSVMEQVPRFALAWLGMGSDGHIASLFPNTDPRADDPRSMVQLTPDPLPPEAPFDRISLTIGALLESAEVVFVIRGADKTGVMAAALAGGSDLPVARLLAAARQPVTVFAG